LEENKNIFEEAVSGEVSEKAANEDVSDGAFFELNDDFKLNTPATPVKNKKNKKNKKQKPEMDEKARLRKKKQAKKNLKAFLWIFGIMATAIVLAVVGIIVLSDMFGIRIGAPSGRATIRIEQGTTAGEIADILSERGVINNPNVFKFYSKIKGFDAQYKYGVYEFGYDWGYEDIASDLIKYGEKAETVTVRIPEAATIDDIAKLLSKNGVCTKDEFFEAMENSSFDYDFIKEIPTDKVHYRLEGYLFPDTYEFYTYGSVACAEEAIDRMLAQTAKHLDANAIKQIKATGRTVHEVITMASIVEMEASAAPEEMPKVAQVFYNRLVWDEPHYLGSSPTADYPYGDGTYNTNAGAPNATEGMPPGPYCAPSANAIKAAIYPDTGCQMTYFVTDSEMVFYYNSSYRDHVNTINRLKNEGKWAG